MSPTPEYRESLTYEDALVLAAYANWSEEVYRAGFYSPNEHAVKSFIADLERKTLDEDYEAEMLQLYRELRK